MLLAGLLPLPVLLARARRNDRPATRADYAAILVIGAALMPIHAMGFVDTVSHYAWVVPLLLAANRLWTRRGPTATPGGAPGY